MKIKKGSILAYSLILISMMLAIAVSVSSVTTIEKKNANSTAASVQAYQIADSEIKFAFKKIDDKLISNSTATIKSLFSNCSVVSSVAIVADVSSAGPTGSKYQLNFYSDIEATTLLDSCDASLSNIKNIKALGFYKNTVRAVSATVPLHCGASNVVDIVDSNIFYRTVVGEDGRCWLDRNLGATELPIPTPDKNNPKSYGWYFQWGRLADDHQISNSDTKSGPINFKNQNKKFITVVSGDWLLAPNDSLWQGIAPGGIDNPCPVGFRVPSALEWNNYITIASLDVSSTVSEILSKKLHLQPAGHRPSVGGVILGILNSALYWSSSADSGDSSKAKGFNNGAVVSVDKSQGMPIRCILNQ